MNSDEPRKFLTYPAVIDWLQWDAFPVRLDKPDYPQLTLSLIAEYRDEVKSLAAENARMKTALEVYAMTNKTFPEYGDVARECLEALKGGEG